MIVENFSSMQYFIHAHINTLKGKSFLWFTKYHTVEKYLLLNLAPHHEEVLGAWRNISTHS